MTKLIIIKKPKAIASKEYKLDKNHNLTYISWGDEYIKVKFNKAGKMTQYEDWEGNWYDSKKCNYPCPYHEKVVTIEVELLKAVKDRKTKVDVKMRIEIFPKEALKILTMTSNEHVNGLYFLAQTFLIIPEENRVVCSQYTYFNALSLSNEGVVSKMHLNISHERPLV